jgi:SAM-dependent methyltransferase
MLGQTSCRSDKIETFHVPYRAFFDAFPSPHLEAIGVAMRQLIDRFDIRGKDVLGLGSSVLAEERFFHDYGGCRISAIDIDESGTLRPGLAAMPYDPNGLTYHCGDAVQFLAPYRRLGFSIPPPRQFDVVFACGYYPDEVRRREVMGQCWHHRTGPFHQSIIHAAQRLRPGGLLIVQSYAYGIDVAYHQHFLPAMHRQLRSIGMELSECYRFQQTTGVNLFIGRRPGGCLPSLATPITRIHGRAAAQEPVEMTWPRKPQ